MTDNPSLNPSTNPEEGSSINMLAPLSHPKGADEARVAEAGQEEYSEPPAQVVSATSDKEDNYFLFAGANGILPPPVWLLDLLKVTETKKEHFDRYMRDINKQLGTSNKGRSPHAALDAMCRQLASLPEHSRRNNYLHWAASRCFEDSKIPVTEFRRALTNAALAAGLDMQEIDTTINSAQRGVFDRS